MPTLCWTALWVARPAVVGTFHASYRKNKYAPGRPLDGYNFGRPITTMLMKRWARRLDGRIAVSSLAVELASKYFSGDYHIIPNGVELGHFSPDVPPIDEFCDGKVNILFVGRLEKRKGVNYLLKAYKSIKRENPDCRLIIVGPGARLYRRYQKQIAREGIEDVVLVGSVPNEDLPRYYKTADIFCAPATRCESFGVVLLEAMAVGVPVVASDVEGYANVVTHGEDGLLVPPKDDSMLAKILTSLINDKSLREQMGAVGKLNAQHYSWEKVARRIQDFYMEVLNGQLRKKELMESESHPEVR